MRRAAFCAAMLGLFAAAAPAAQGAGLSLTPAGTPTFPQRAFRLTIPQQRHLLAKDIEATENGDPVSQVRLVSAKGAEGGEFGAVLVIDTSQSMHGATIRSAVAAARLLAQERTGAQKLGIMYFNRTPSVVLAPTDDQAAINAALSRTPAVAPQTRIFDATSAALDMLRRADITAGSIVMLSDGSDTGSVATAAAVARRARKANVTIYTIGLRSRAFDSGELKGLAAAGRGQYIPAASVSDVRRIFRDLGARLASDYLLTYRSAAKPGSDVTLAVRAQGVPGLATSTYRVPGGASYVEVRRSFWTSTVGLALTAGLTTLLLAAAFAILLVRRTRRPALRDRVGSFVSTPGDVVLDLDALITGRKSSSTERSLERTRWWAAFREDVEIADIGIDPARLVIWTAIATLVLMWALVLVTGLVLVGLFAVIVPWGVRTWVRIARDRRRALFADQLPEVLQGAASAIRAGHGLVAALSMVAVDAPEPCRSEFARVVSDEGFGVPLEEALRTVQTRMASREVMQVALVAQVQREAGGNMAEVLDRIVDALRQASELRRMVRALTAQGRLSRWVVTALPVGLLLALTVLNASYVRPLFTEPLGLFLLGAACLMMALGSLVIGKIVDFEV